MLHLHALNVLILTCDLLLQRSLGLTSSSVVSYAAARVLLKRF